MSLRKRNDFNRNNSSNGQRRRLNDRQPIRLSYSGDIADIEHDKIENFKPKKKKSHKKLRKGLKIFAICIFLVFGFLIGRAILTSLGIVDRSGNIRALALRDSFDLTELKGEGDGRVNILLIGVGGANHDGGALSDVNLVVSIDPISKDVEMLSIPRDLYVPVPGYYSARINEAHYIGEQASEGGGPKLAMQTVESALGVPIHYYVRTDFTGFEEAVDAVGGVDITVEEDLYDPTFPDRRMDGYEPFQISAGKHHMDGRLALRYARCRKGNCGDDFGRAQRQQQVLNALKDKALSIGTLSNPIKVNDLISAAGNHVKTDLNLREIAKLIKIAEEADTSKLKTHVLGRDDTEGMITNAWIGGDVLIPALGQNDFSAVQAYVRSLFVDGFIKDEAAKVVVLNGTTTDGLATSVGDNLKTYGYKVTAVGDYSSKDVTDTMLIANKKSKNIAKTTKYLERRFRTKATKDQKVTNQYPDADLVIVVGSDYNQ